MKFGIIIFLMILQTLLTAVPILTDVSISDSSDVRINFKIENLPEDNVRLEVVCFNDSTELQIFSSAEKDCSLKEGFNTITIKKSVFPDDYNVTKYMILPKLIYNGRIYYEMQVIKSGSYPYNVEKGIMDLVTVKKFYISKFEITNEQFEAFVNADGYEFQEYWEISPKLMGKSDIGWYYLSKYKMTLPHGWKFANKPYYKDADSHLKYGPVTNIRWFEAYAFANWMGYELPTFEQMKVAFIKSKQSHKAMYSGITEFINGRFPLQKIKDGVSEWLESGVEPNSISCAGCNEMYFIENNSDYMPDKISYSVKCPLFRAPFLGARLVKNTDRESIK